jgi:hypothetical protein
VRLQAVYLWVELRLVWALLVLLLAKQGRLPLDTQAPSVTSCRLNVKLAGRTWVLLLLAVFRTQR